MDKVKQSKQDRVSSANYASANDPARRGDNCPPAATAGSQQLESDEINSSVNFTTSDKPINPVGGGGEIGSSFNRASEVLRAIKSGNPATVTAGAKAVPTFSSQE